MSQDYRESIADGSLRRTARRVYWIVLAAALAAGVAAAFHYANAGLTLSHYDARAHLVVARRVTDNLTPGWRQFGAVWLPLPHLLNALPVMWDWAYRTGAVAVGMSIAAMAFGAAAISRALVIRTGSAAIALSVPALGLLNPNVLYLTATPMTEPLLLGLALLAVVAFDAWTQGPSSARATRAGLVLAALVMTRYEGWVLGAALLLTAAVVSRSRKPRLPLAMWVPTLAAVPAFALLGWASTGTWFLSTAFFVPDPSLHHRLDVVIDKMAGGLIDLGGPILAASGLVGLLALFWRARHAPSVLLFACLAASAALPLFAFYQGHPYRVRYLIPLVVSAAVMSGFAVAALPRRLRTVAAVSLVAGVLWTRPPLDSQAAMVLEAQWETPFRLDREKVTAELLRRDDGTPILASMGSLGHYMHEASRARLPLRRFLHEGNGDLWAEAVKSPRRSVRWMLIEERAEGGDELAARARQDPLFLEGFVRAFEAGGLVLYARTAPGTRNSPSRR